MCLLSVSTIKESNGNAISLNSKQLFMYRGMVLFDFIEFF